MSAVVLGVVTIFSGLLFLNVPGNFVGHSNYLFLNGTSVTFGTIFLALGVWVVVAALLDFSRAVVPCAAMGALWSVYTIFSVVNPVQGYSSGLEASWALGIACLSCLAMIATVLPSIESKVRQMEANRA